MMHVSGPLRGNLLGRPSYFKYHRLVGLVVNAAATRAADWDSIPVFPVGPFLDRVILVTSELVPQWLPFHVPGVIGSALGLVGPMSVYCD